jgi:TetR/AcrR family transcriptional regulator, cholesterol catabolism regulator
VSGIRSRRAAAAAIGSEAYLEKQRAILAAAGEVFREKGFHATKLNDVAERAGMDRASLYYYVGSKDDLFRDVVSRTVSANVAVAEEVARLNAPAHEKLAKILDLLMSSFEREYPFIYVFVQEDPKKLAGPDPASAEAWAPTLRRSERFFEIVREIVAEGIATGDLVTSLPAAVVANCLIGMMNSTHLWFRPDGSLHAEEIASGLAEMVLRGLERTS